MTKFIFEKKMTKNNLRIISKPHAYLQTMSITHVKLYNKWHETVVGVAYTRWPLFNHFHCQNARKSLSSNYKKVTKIY